MRFRGTPTFGGGSYYKLIGSVHAGAPAQPGDAQIEHGGNAKRDRALRKVDEQRVPGAVVAAIAGTRIAVDEMANVDPSVYAGLHTVQQETRPNEQSGTNQAAPGPSAIEP
jgi:hypothetical protein